MNSNYSAPANNSSNTLIIIVIAVVLLIAFGIGGYFIYKSKACPDNCSDTSCTNKKCTKCNSGYGTKLAGTPATDGSCPSYYKEYDGIDYRGPANDITHVPSTDKDDCISKCSAQTNPSCMFASTDGTTCWLKNGFGLDAPKGFANTKSSVLAPVTLQVPPTSSS